ncbi:MAG: hypothetical protein J6W75_06855 [Bacteroidaceae bacterium]|nr:hypothetical protein [Bacteroidaceae bacterium]
MSKKDEFLSRRDFFKKATKKTLPFLGAIVLGPTISLTTLASCGCDSCEAACMDNCEDSSTGSCANTCEGSCQWNATSSSCSNCSSTCSKSSSSEICSSCATACSGACKNTCSSTCEGSATGKSDVSTADGKINGYEYVDMGLSVKWARCNLGASKPEDYGSYYAFGDYSGNNVKNGNSIEKYYKYGMFENEGSICGTQYDSAKYRMGNPWRMPSQSEFIELINNCSVEFCSYNGTNGVKLISKINGNSIFLPAAGGYGLDLDNVTYVMWCKKGESGFYWSGDVHWYRPASIASAYYWGFDFEKQRYAQELSTYNENMFEKNSIRPVTTGSGGGGGCTGSSCSANCANNATGSGCSGCSTSCSTSCKTDCEGSCINGCNTLCGGQCHYSCGGTCTYVSAGSKCTACARTCSTYCYGTCTLACSSSCQSQCIYGSK